MQIAVEEEDLSSRFAAVNSLYENEIDQQAVNDKIVNPQMVKEQNALKTETSTIPAPMIFGNSPRSLVIHAKYAKIGDKKANTVHPTINARP